MKIKKEIKIGLPDYSNITVGIADCELPVEADKMIHSMLLDKKDAICGLIGEAKFNKYLKLFE